MAQSQIDITPKMVFPSTKMSAVNKLITEGNLTRLINKLIDTDSYLIPTSNIDFTDSENALDVGTLIKIPTLDRNSDLEFVIHGYYFNLGEIANVLSNFSQGNEKIIAQIYIDTTVPEYPELGGQTSLIDTVTVNSSPIEANATLPEAYRNVSIESMYCYYDDDKYTVTYNSADYSLTVLDLPDGVEITTSDIPSYYINVIDYSAIINLYLVGETELVAISNSDSVNETASATQDIYTLDIAHRHNGVDYFLLDSFVKFGSQVISNIDGGII